MPQPAGRRRAAANRTRQPAPGTRRPTAPRRPPQSDLDRALDASLDAPAPAATAFRDLGLPDALVTALEHRGLRTAFPIQARTLPDALAGRDVLGRAQTGSGKTLAFGLPMLTRLADSTRRRAARAPRGLVVVPTRELARQVADALTPLGHALSLNVATVYGGAPIGRQIDRLRRGADVVVATPGRLIDLLDRGACTLDNVEAAVVDEADHMADLGFLPAVTRILDATPPDGQRLLFSATLDRGVDGIVRTYLTDPGFHAVASAAAPVEAVDHRVFVLPDGDKVGIAAEIAERPGRTLIFVRTKHGAARLAKQLTRAGVQAAAIHGNLNQNQRQRALADFAAGHPRVLVATDVAARGIHVDDIDLVMHFDPPDDHKGYLHRSGRTARAGARGTVLTLAAPNQVRGVAQLHDAVGVTAASHRVYTGHDAVRKIATSGTPVPVPSSQPRHAVPRKTKRPQARAGDGSGRGRQRPARRVDA